MHVRRMLVTAVLACAAATAVGAHPAWGAPRVGLVADGLGSPVAVAAPRGDDRLFVASKEGVVHVVTGRRVLPRPFLDLRGHVNDRGVERGLLGIAFHPRYRVNRRVFVSYTARDGAVRVAEFRASRTRRNVARPGSARQVMAVPHPGRIHNGGHLAFGPDGYLYVSLGDAGPAGDPRGFAQSLRTRLGKILRIDVDRRPARHPRRYAIPRDNPFRGVAGVRPEIYHYGLRNPWRFSFDRATGDMWIGDVGQNAVEEVNVARAEEGAGLNFGWNVFEGRSRYRSVRIDLADTRPPVAQYRHGRMGCSVIGGHVYRGRAIASLRGRYVFGDFCSGRVFTVRADRPTRWGELTSRLGGPFPGITSFGEDGRGELLMLVGDGVYRFLPPAPRRARG